MTILTNLRGQILCLLFLVMFTSCKVSEGVFSIESGGYNHHNTNASLDSLVANNATFITYEAHGLRETVPSNTITYSAYRILNTDTDASGEKSKKGKKLKEKKKKVKGEKKKKIKGGKTKKNKERKSKNKVKKQTVKNQKSKAQYAFANVSKSYSKINAFNIITDVIALAALVPSSGQSAYLMKPIRERDYLIQKKCIHDGKCTGKEHALTKTVLIEVGVHVKRDEIKSNVLLIEHLPESYVVTNYRMRKKRGKKSIDSLHAEVRSDFNGKKYYEFQIVPKNGRFTKSCKAWFFLDVKITPSKKDYFTSEN